MRGEASVPDSAQRWAGQRLGEFRRPVITRLRSPASVVFQQSYPSLDSGTATGRDLEHDGPGASLLEVPPGQRQVESDGAGEVELGDQRHIRRVDKRGVL